MANTEPARQGLSDAELGGANRNFTVPDMGDYCLLPGDPQRITLMASQWDEGTAKEYDLKRGYRAATGNYKGVRISATSTGVGGPSLEPPFTDLAAKGMKTFIRVGTTGAIQEGINIGDIVINDGSVRLDGLSRLYIRDEYPAVASPEVTMALIQACEQLGYTYHVGIGCTTGSFFAGQSRMAYGGYKRLEADSEYQNLRDAKVLNYEMEGAALFTLCRIYGLRAGMCAAVVAQRITGEFRAEGVDVKACLVAAEAVRILTEWDGLKSAAGRAYFTPDLLK
jgi:uridine phosphorylase